MYKELPSENEVIELVKKYLNLTNSKACNFANRVGISPTTLNRWMNKDDYYVPKEDIIKRIYYQIEKELKELYNEFKDFMIED